MADAPSLSRPLGLTEQFYHDARGDRGGADIFFILQIDLPHGCGNAEDVVSAWALLRLQHPLLASSVTITGTHPSFLYIPPSSLNEALENARAFCTFSTFPPGQSSAAASSLHRRFGTVSKHDMIDIPSTTSSLEWLSPDASDASTEHVLCIRCRHFAADAAALFTVARSLFALLSSPGTAQKELHEYFSLHSHAVPQIPEALEDLYPVPVTMSTSAVPLQLKPSGLLANGRACKDDFAGAAIRHAWSVDDTTAIIHACKTHGITVTQLFCAALALATFPPSVSSSTPEEILHFTFMPAIDLRSLLPPSTTSNVAVRIGHFPLTIHLPSNTPTQSPSALWDAASKARTSSAAFLASPDKWAVLHAVQVKFSAAMAFARSAGPTQPHPAVLAWPFLPSLSSLGVCDVLLQVPGVIVRDMVLAAQVLPVVVSSHLWTLGGRMNLLVSYNVAHMSEASMDEYFQHVLCIVGNAIVAAP